MSIGVRPGRHRVQQKRDRLLAAFPIYSPLPQFRQDTGERQLPLCSRPWSPHDMAPGQQAQGKQGTRQGPSNTLSPEPFHFPDHIFTRFQAWRINFKAQLEVQSVYFTFFREF